MRSFLDLLRLDLLSGGDALDGDRIDGVKVVSIFEERAACDGSDAGIGSKP